LEGLKKNRNQPRSRADKPPGVKKNLRIGSIRIQQRSEKKGAKPGKKIRELKLQLRKGEVRGTVRQDLFIGEGKASLFGDVGRKKHRAENMLG